MRYAYLILPILIVMVLLVVVSCKKIPKTETTTETYTTTITKPTENKPTEAEITTLTESKTSFVPSPYLEETERITTTSGYVSPSQFRKMGIIYADGYKYTWYSEKVLPGGGLNIPGRHSDGNYVRDEDEYIVLASSDLPKGTIVETPFGTGKVYDSGCASGVIDVYTSF